MFGKTLALCVAVSLVLAGTAQAGFILDTIEVGLPTAALASGQLGPPGWAQCPAWTRQMVGELLTLDVKEVSQGLEPFPIVVSGMTDSDPVFRMTKEVLNDTGVTWTGYKLEIDTSSATFDDYAASSHFNAATVTPGEILFEAPDPVPDGETLAMTFDVLVPTIGEFQVCITQTPIPEPATLAFLGVGAAGVFLVRRRRAAR